jgi:hypothetical protein
VGRPLWKDRPMSDLDVTAPTVTQTAHQIVRPTVATVDA